MSVKAAELVFTGPIAEKMNKQNLAFPLLIER